VVEVIPDYKPAILSVCDHSGAWSRPFLDMGYEVIRIDPKHGKCDHEGNGYGAVGDYSLNRMDDGGWAWALTASQLADHVNDEGGYYIDEVYTRCMQGESAYQGLDIVGMLLAPPCTDFSCSGARHFAAKDAEGRTEKSGAMVRDCLRLVDAVEPDWWCHENPRGRIKRLVPELGQWLMHFNPADYAGFADDPDKESYSKDTYLYGDFNPDLPKNEREIVWYYDSKGNRGSWQWKHLGGKSERTKELRSVTPTGFAHAFAQANG